MDIRIVRLSTGEDLVCEVKNAEKFEKGIDGSIIIKKPLQVALRPIDNKGSFSPAFAPWMPYADTTNLKISGDFVMFTLRADSSIENHYRSVVGGIVLAAEPERKPLQLVQE